MSYANKVFWRIAKASPTIAFGVALIGALFVYTLKRELEVITHAVENSPHALSYDVLAPHGYTAPITDIAIGEFGPNGSEQVYIRAYDHDANGTIDAIDFLGPTPDDLSAWASQQNLGLLVRELETARR